MIAVVTMRRLAGGCADVGVRESGLAERIDKVADCRRGWMLEEEHRVDGTKRRVSSAEADSEAFCRPTPDLRPGLFYFVAARLALAFVVITLHDVGEVGLTILLEHLDRLGGVGGAFVLAHLEAGFDPR